MIDDLQKILSLPKVLRRVNTGKNGSSDLRQDASRVVSDYRKSLKKGKGYNFYYVSGDVVKRRIQATIRCAPEIAAHYAPRNASKTRLQELERSLLSLSLETTESMNRQEKQYHILWAAGTWILDQVSRQPDWSPKFFTCLPTDEDILYQKEVPEVWDPSYNEDLHYTIMHVLYYRNSDLAPMEADDDGTDRVLINSLMANNGQHANVPSRRTFEDIMAQVPREAVEQAVEHFKQLFELWMKRFYACLDILKEPIDKDAKKANSLADEYEAMNSDMLAIAKEAKNKNQEVQNTVRKKTARSKNKEGNPDEDLSAIFLKNLPSITSSSFVGYTNSNVHILQAIASSPVRDITQELKQMIMTKNEHARILEEIADQEQKVADFLFEIRLDGCLDEQTCQEQFGPAVAKRMKPLPVSDPYEICFALLWLLENNSDLPWLLGPVHGMMEEVLSCLPWAGEAYDERFDEPFQYRLRWTRGESAEDAPPEAPAPGKTRKGMEIPDWYERKYVSTGAEDGMIFHRSLAQILYEESGCLLPRDLRRFEDQIRNVKKYGVTKKDSQMLLYLVAALQSVKFQYQADNLDPFMLDIWTRRAEAEEKGLTENDITMEILEEQQEEMKSAAAEAEPEENLRERLAQLQEENEKLRTSLRDSEQVYQQLNTEIAGERQKYDLEHSELSELRNVIFPALEEEQAEETPADETVFPYEVQKVTVVFGGHEAWLKAINLMLRGNIRFIDKDLVFDLAIVRNADMIWIQANAMSHKQYYRIIDAARQYRKPVRYFAFASAAKGAEQVMHADGV